MGLLPDVTIAGTVVNRTDFDLTPWGYGSTAGLPDSRIPGGGWFTEDPGSVRAGQSGNWKAVYGTPDLTVDMGYKIGGTGWSVKIYAKNPAIGSNQASSQIVWDNGGTPPKGEFACSADMGRGWDAKVTLTVWKL